MSPPVDISILRRLVDPFVQSSPEIQAAIAPIMEAADSDGVANEEDNELTQEEARRFLERTRRQTQAGLRILSANCSSLVGGPAGALDCSSLAGALSELRERLENAGASTELLSLLELAAGQDSDAEALSAEEADLLVQTFQQNLQQVDEMTAADFLTDASHAIQQLTRIGRSIPEALVPEDAADRRRSIDLNFLKDIPSTVIFSESEQGQILQQLLLFGNILNPEAMEPTPGMLLDPNPDLDVLLNREANWDITYEEVREAYENLPADARSEVPNPETLMANLRFLTHLIREDFNAREAEAVRSGGDDAAEGIDLSPLLARRAQFANNPFALQLIEVAGDDGVLTRTDVEEHLREVEENNPGLDIDPELYLASATQLVEVLSAATPEELAAMGEEGAYTREEYLNRMVIDDLKRMREGFTRMDLDYVENDSLFAFANAGVHVFTAVGTLGLYHLLDGPSWRDFRREQAEAGDTHRANAIRALETLLTHPDREFRGWLETRPEGAARLVTVANALEYMRSYEERFNHRLNSLLTHEISEEELRRYLADYESGDPARIAGIPAEHLEYVEYRSMYEENYNSESSARSYLFQFGNDSPRIVNGHYELLVSDTLQADRLWEIRSMTDRQAGEEAWFAFAQDLRDGVWSNDFDSTVLARTSNPDFARAILHGLRRQSTDPEMRSQARIAYQDSIGADITDDEGNVTEEGGGEFNLWPPDWFRNFSDENASYAINDIILLVATWRAGGMLFRGGTRLISTGGRVLGRGAMSLLGIGALGMEGAGAAGVGLAGRAATAEGPGLVSRLLARMVGRQVQTATDRLIALEAARAAGQRVTAGEIAAAREAVTNASRVHQILTAPIQASLPQRAASAVAERVLRPDAWAGRILTRLGTWNSRAGTFLANAAETRVGGYAVNTLAATLWVLSRSARLTGRFLRYLSYEGIVTMGIAGYLYEAAPRHSNQPLVHDREYDLELPEAPRPTRRRDADTETPRVSPRPEDPAPEEDDDAEGSPPPVDEEAARLARGIVEDGE